MQNLNELTDLLSPHLIGVSIKAFALSLVGTLVYLLCRRFTASTRHLILTMTMLVVLIVPACSLIVPDLTFHVPGSWMHSSAATSSAAAESELSGQSPRTTSSLSTKQMPSPDVSPSTRSVTSRTSADLSIPETATHSIAQTPSISDASAADQVTSAASELPLSDRGKVSLTVWVSGLWFAGTTLTAIFLLFGYCQLARFRRDAAVGDSIWRAALAEACATLNIRREIKVLILPNIDSPLTWGFFHPIIAVPKHNDWTDERRQVVLLHELAHIKRFDWTTQMLAQVTCAVYWWNPLMWFVSRRLRAEQERATDDLVLQAGATDTDYAAQLIHFAGRIQSSAPGVALPMARRSTFEQRVRDILDRKRIRGAVNARLIAAALVISACVLIPIAMLNAETEFRRPHPVSVSKGGSQRDVLTAWYTHDGRDVEYAILSVSRHDGDGAYNTSSECTSNAVSRTWDDSGTITVDGTDIPFRRSSKQPDRLGILGSDFDLRAGRTFIVRTVGYEQPQVDQVNVALTSDDFKNIEDVFRASYQPAVLNVAECGYSYGVPDSSEIGNMEVYSLNDGYRTRVAIFHDSNTLEKSYNGSNDPIAGTWKIDTTLTTERGHSYRLRLDSENPENIVINQDRFDLTQGCTFEAITDGSIIQHTQFPGMIRDTRDMGGLYAHFRGLQPKPSPMSVNKAIAKERKYRQVAPTDLSSAYIDRVPDHAVQQKLSHGGAVRFHALYSKERQQWWSPRGPLLKPLPDWERHQRNWPEADVLGVFEWVHPHVEPPATLAGPNGEPWATPMHYVAIPIKRDGADPVFRVGFGAGPWKNRGRVTQGSFLRHGSMNVSFSELIIGLPRDPDLKPDDVRFQHSGSVTAVCSVTMQPEEDFALLAVDKSGIRRRTAPTHNGNGRPVAPGSEWLLRLICTGTDIDSFSHLELLTRQRCWAQFSGFASQPLNESIDVVAESYNPAGEQPPRATTPALAVRQFLRSLDDRNDALFFHTVTDLRDSVPAVAFFRYEAAFSHFKQHIIRRHLARGWKDLKQATATGLHAFCDNQRAQFHFEQTDNGAIAQHPELPDLYLRSKDGDWLVDLQQTLQHDARRRQRNFAEVVSELESRADVLQEFRSRITQFGSVAEMDQKLAETLKQLNVSESR